MSRELHPFVSKSHFNRFINKQVTFVAKIERVEGSTIVMRINDETEVQVHKFNGDPEAMKTGSIMQIKGIVNQDSQSMTYGEHYQYDDEFDLEGHEVMLQQYHGATFRELTVGN